MSDNRVSLHKKNWLKKYFQSTNNHDAIIHSLPTNILSNDLRTYATLQTTGFPYGQGNQFIFHNVVAFEKYASTEASKLFFFEGMILVSKLNSNSQTEEAHLSAIQFYFKHLESVNLSKPEENSCIYATTEKLLDSYTDRYNTFASKLFNNHFSNCIQTLDLILFQECLTSPITENLQEKRTNTLLNLIKIVKATAWVDGSIAVEERSILKALIKNANFDAENYKKANKILVSNISIESITFDEKPSELMSRYLLEMAIFTACADHNLDTKELALIEELTERLGLSKEICNNSFLAIQQFIADKKSKNNYSLSKSIRSRLFDTVKKDWSRILRINKEKLQIELKESKVLLELLSKATREDLSKEELNTVKTQLGDLAKTIPSFALFLLPGGSLVLPIIIKLIPNLLPSAFKTNVL
jgi:tellurite resistance protein